MPYRIIRADVTSLSVDAIVNPTDRYLSAGGGTDRQIRIAAGEGLEKVCREKGKISESECFVTSGFSLPAKHIVHVCSPDYTQNGEAMLRNLYTSVLEVCEAQGFESVAFPLISSGTKGFPKEKALKIAISSIGDYLFSHDIDVTVAVYDGDSYAVGKKLFADVKSYIDDNYVAEKRPAKNRFLSSRESAMAQMSEKALLDSECICERSVPLIREPSLEDELENLDESFSEMLLRKIDESGMTDAQCYKKANVDRKHFSKIRSNRDYKASKPTVIAFAIALELSLSETRDMLKKAGYALSKSNKFDVIIEYFITHGNYDMFEINEVLFRFDQNILGS